MRTFFSLLAAANSVANPVERWRTIAWFRLDDGRWVWLNENSIQLAAWIPSLINENWEEL